MEKTKIAAVLSRQESSRSEAELAREPGANEPRPLADWELVMVGGGDMSPDW